MRLYKLTDKHDRTYGGCQWGAGIEHTASGEGNLCTGGWIHAYTDPLLAILLNPIHADFDKPHLWEAEGEIGKDDHGLKVGCTKLKTLKRISKPRINKIQRIAFGILCAKKVCKNKAWAAWANNWLSGKNRTKEAAWAAWAARAEAVRVEEAAWEAVRAAWAAAAAAAAARAAAVGATKPLDLPAIAKQAMKVKV